MTERVSLDSLFRQCVERAAQLAKESHGLIAVEVNNSIESINDSYFRTQVWGSDLGVRSTQQITFTDLLSTENSMLSATIEDALKGFSDQFEVIDRVLGNLGANHSSAVIVPKERPHDLLLELRAAVAAIAELVRTLVDLSGPIKIEQALQKNAGPYKNLQKQVEQTKISFQEHLLGAKTKEPRTVSPAPIQEEQGPLTDPVGLRETDRQPGSLNLTGKGKQTGHALTSTGSNHSEHFTPDDGGADIWSKTYLLTLDGGGIRTLSSLLILRALMHAVEELEIGHDSLAKSKYSPGIDAAVSQGVPSNKQSVYLPCHYFDYIAGTSTGGLVAIMLGRLRMSVEECIKEFEILGAKRYGRRSLVSAGGLLGFGRERHNASMLEDSIKRLVKEKEGLDPLRTASDGFGSEPHMCKTMVVSRAERLKSKETYIFRSYDHEPSIESPYVQAGLARNLGLAHDVPIWRVARATTAAPTYFRPVKIGQYKFVDGGAGANNPTMEAVMEVTQLNKQSKKTVGLVLSIGTGKDEYTQTGRTSSGSKYRKYLRSADKWTIDSDRTHRTVGHYARDFGFAYNRLDLQSDLGAFKFKGFKANGREIITQFYEYLQERGVQTEIEKIAEKLVENRQKRSRDSPTQWELFCRGKTTTKSAPTASGKKKEQGKTSLDD